jgi:hypothetical protein
MARFALSVDTYGARDDVHAVERWMEASGAHHASPCHAPWALGPVSGAGGEPAPKYFDLSALLKITQSPVVSMSGGHSEDLDRDDLPVTWQNVRQPTTATPTPTKPPITHPITIHHPPVP